MWHKHKVFTTHMGDQDGIPGSYFGLDPTWLSVGIFEVNKWMEDTCSNFSSLHLSIYDQMIYSTLGSKSIISRKFLLKFLFEEYSLWTCSYHIKNVFLKWKFQGKLPENIWKDMSKVRTVFSPSRHLSKEPHHSFFLLFLTFHNVDWGQRVGQPYHPIHLNLC